MNPDTFQHNKPVFVKRPFFAGGRKWEKGSEFTWLTHHFPTEKVQILFREGFIHHNKDLEVEHRIGDRLEELNLDQLNKLKDALNHVLKPRTTNKAQFSHLKCKASRVEDRQRGLIRRFLDQNPWFVVDEDLIREGKDFASLRDKILGEK